MSEKPIAHQFLHSCYVNRLPDGSDAVVISEYAHYKDGRVVPELRIEKKPKRSFYITKPSHRNHNEKKEIEPVAKLDKYTVYNCELEREIFRALNGYYPSGYVKLKELCASPYLYGADVHIETLIKAHDNKLFDKSGLTPVPATTGFFDIERLMIEGSAGRIHVISLTHENNIYTAILENTFFKIDAQGNKSPGVLEELQELSRGILNPMIEQLLATNKGLKRHRGKKFNFFYYIGKTEIDLICWIFARMHENKTSLIGIWNLNYDIPAIIAAIENAKVELSDIFCPPDLLAQYRKVNYVFDNKKVAHPTDKWHWLYCTSYSQFYDSTALYAKLRTVIGKENSYKLNDVLQKNDLGEKLHFHELPEMDDLSDADWHRRMQSRYPYHYIVYNQWDVISLQLMEWKNSDAQSMLRLSESTSLSKYTKQTRKISDTLYVDWMEKGFVLGTSSADMTSPYDAEIGKTGGAVLSPLRLDYNGLNALTEAPHHKTQLHPYVNDVDFTGMYPSVAQGGNISKDTKLSTVIYITGESVQKYHTPRAAVEAFFGYVVNPEDNAVALGVEFFGLPDFDAMLTLYENSIGNPP